jgi:hypothetical protein
MNKTLAQGETLPLDFYVYMLLDQTAGRYRVLDVDLPGVPFYLGKGKGDRAFDHFREAKRKTRAKQGNFHKLSTINNLENKSANAIVYIFKDGLTDENALQLEKQLGDLIGYRMYNSGPLTNLIKTGTKNPVMFGSDNSFFGKSHTKDTKNKISKASKLWHLSLSDEERAIKNLKRSAKMKGRSVDRALVEYRLECKYGMDFRETKRINLITAQIAKDNKLEQRAAINLEKKMKRSKIDFLRDNNLINAGSRNPMFGRGDLLEGAKNGKAKKFVISIDKYIFHIEGRLKEFRVLFKQTFCCSDPVRSEGFKNRYNVILAEVNRFPLQSEAIYFIGAESFEALKGEKYEKCKSR